jgi:osmotically inducible protein OsmC
MAAKRTARAVWEHDLKSGSGEVTGETGALPRMQVTWAARTEAPGGKTSPEELLAAAFASCFAMAFSSTLAGAGHPSERLEVRATATFDKVETGWKVTTMDVDIGGKVPGLDAKGFETAAREMAEKGCPISNAIKGNVAVHVTAHLL